VFRIGNIFISGNIGCALFSGGFVCKINLNSTTFEYSTYLNPPNQCYGTAIAVDINGSAYITGTYFTFPDNNEGVNLISQKI